MSWLHANAVGLLPPAEPYRLDEAGRSETSAAWRAGKLWGCSAAWGPQEGLGTPAASWPWGLCPSCWHGWQQHREDSLASSGKQGICFFTGVKPVQWHCFLCCSYRFGWGLRVQLRPGTPAKLSKIKGEWGRAKGEGRGVWRCSLCTSWGLWYFQLIFGPEVGGNMPPGVGKPFGTLQLALGTVLQPGLCIHSASACPNGMALEPCWNPVLKTRQMQGYKTTSSSPRSRTGE